MNRLSSSTRLVIGLVGSLAGLATILVLTGWLLHAGREVPPPDPQPQRLTIAQLRQADQAALNSYGVVDRERGVVRIPIEQAMEKALAESFQLPAPPTTRKVQTNRVSQNPNSGATGGLSASVVRPEAGTGSKLPVAPNRQHPAYETASE